MLYITLNCFHREPLRCSFDNEMDMPFVKYQIMRKRLLSGSLILLLIISISTFTSCEYEFIEPEKVVIDIPPEGISFSDDIIPIFNSSCNNSGCHAAGFSILDLSPANAYNQLFAKGLLNTDVPDQSELYLKLTDTRGTHKDRSTPTEQALILEWIVGGAKNN